MESYTFYFDESFHDRKIRVNEKGQFNILREDALDNYIGVFWGCPSSDLGSNRKLIQKFEDRQRAHYGLSKEQELKSTIISKKNFKYGVRSFNKDTLNFYREFFELLEIINPVLQINMVSKTELYLRIAFKGLVYKGVGLLSENAFYYTLTKFMLTYHNEELLKSLYNVQDYKSLLEFKKLLQYNFRCIINEIRGIKRKEMELTAFQNILYILENSVIKELPEKEYNFQYYINFEGLCKLLDEKNIDIRLVSVVIDEEQKTYLTAQNYAFYDVRCGKSEEMIELRLSDWLASFIGRFIYGIYNDEGMKEDKVTNIREIGKNDLESKRLLSKQWFDLDEKQFNLYQLIYEALIIGHTEYWTAMAMSFADQCVDFYSLIRYFSKYDSYKRYKKIDAKLHSEYFNCDTLVELQHLYQSFIGN